MTPAERREALQLTADFIQDGRVTNHRVIDLFAGIADAYGLSPLAYDVRSAVAADDQTNAASDWCLAALIRVIESDADKLGHLVKGEDG